LFALALFVQVILPAIQSVDNDFANFDRFPYVHAAEACNNSRSSDFSSGLYVQLVGGANSSQITAVLFFTRIP